jgi:hypothetical protein
MEVRALLTPPFVIIRSYLTSTGNTFSSKEKDCRFESYPGCRVLDPFIIAGKYKIANQIRQLEHEQNYVAAAPAEHLGSRIGLRELFWFT